MRRIATCIVLLGLLAAGCGSSDDGSGQGQPLSPEAEKKVTDLVNKAGDASAPAGKDDLVKLGKPAVPKLIEALKSDSTFARATTAEALGEIGDPKAVDPLIASLKDDDERLRASAAYALGALGDAKAVEPLAAALEDESVLVAANAAEALGKLGDKKALGPLIEAMQFADGDVKFFAHASLKTLSGEDFGYDAAKWKAWHEK